MPLVTCPKCPTQLRIPDGTTGAVRCPKCQTVFQPPKAQPAFEVVDEAPPARPAAPRPAAVPPKPAAPRPASAAKPAQSDFEVVDDDEPKKPTKRLLAKAKDDDDEDDDDRPRKKSRRDDDDEDDDDRPRSRKRSRDDEDDEDDDDRPRKKKKRRDDEDDWAESGSKKVIGAGPAKSGMLMVSIAMWLGLGTFALLTLFMMIGWGGGYIPVGLMVIPGILGLASSVVGVVGSSLCIGGPPRARGLAIVATAVTAVQLVLAFVVANNGDAGLFSERTIQIAALKSKQASDARLMEDAAKDSSKVKLIEERRKERDAFGKEYRDEIMTMAVYEVILAAEKEDEFSEEKVAEFLKNKKSDDMRWIDTASQLPFLDKFLAVAGYHNKHFGDYVFGFLAGLVDLARLLLFVLLIGSVSKAVRGSASGKTKFGLIAMGVAIGVAILLSLLAAAMVEGAQKEKKKIIDTAFSGGGVNYSDQAAVEKKGKELRDKLKAAMWTERNAPAFTRFLNYALFAGMLVIPAIAALQASSEAGRRARR